MAIGIEGNNGMRDDFPVQRRGPVVGVRVAPAFKGAQVTDDTLLSGEKQDEIADGALDYITKQTQREAPPSATNQQIARTSLEVFKRLVSRLQGRSQLAQ